MDLEELRATLKTLLIFFLVLNTITVGLRVLVRTKLTKFFGYDDAAMLFTYAMLVVYTGLCFTALHYGDATSVDRPWFDKDKVTTYDYAFSLICFLISGVVKIAVAMVLHRVTNFQSIQIVLVADMVICAVWTVVNTLVSALGCMPLSPWAFSTGTCAANDYSRQAMYIIFSALHVFLPVVMMWRVQMGGWVKISVVGLFGVGLFACIATVMKLTVVVEWQHATPATDTNDLWLRLTIWSLTEHGLALFACSILAMRPLVKLLGQNWSLIYGGGSKDSKASSGGEALRGDNLKSDNSRGDHARKTSHGSNLLVLDQSGDHVAEGREKTSGRFQQNSIVQGAVFG